MTLDQPIEIKRKSQEQRADGSLETTLTTVMQGFARVRPMRGGESDQGTQVEARAGYKFTIHTRSDLLDDDVIVWRGRKYNIRFIYEEGFGSIYMEIEAERGVAI